MPGTVLPEWNEREEPMTQARKLIVMVLEIKPSTNVMTTASTADLEIAFRSACLDEGFELMSCAVNEDESERS